MANRAKRRAKQRAACPSGKVPYETREGAIWFARTEGMRAYRCPTCGKWHLTSRLKK